MLSMRNVPICLVVLAVCHAQPGMGPPPGGGGGGGNMGTQPSVGGGTGETTVTDALCKSGTTCSTAGNYMKNELTYSNGIFSGSITSNLCPNKSSQTPQASASCIKQTFPDPSFVSSSLPKSAPLLGRAGMTLSGGVNIYGPLEAGFTLGQACTNSKGQCDGGIDVATCEAQLVKQCGATNVKNINNAENMLMDKCGGHASPYHFHTQLACEYSMDQSSAHSPLIAVMLDGRGMYGKWEGSGQAPVLDACNGHTGPVPADSTYGVSAGNVYHYHMTDTPPFTVGCFGPVDTLDACKKLIDKCSSDADVQLESVSGTYKYNTWCTCYQHKGTCNSADFPGLCGGSSSTTTTTSGTTKSISSTHRSAHLSITSLLLASMAVMAISVRWNL